LPKIQKIYKSYLYLGKKHMNLDDAKDLVSRAMPEVGENDVVLSY